MITSSLYVCKEINYHNKCPTRNLPPPPKKKAPKKTRNPPCIAGAGRGEECPGPASFAGCPRAASGTGPASLGACPLPFNHNKSGFPQAHARHCYRGDGERARSELSVEGNFNFAHALDAREFSTCRVYSTRSLLQLAAVDATTQFVRIFGMP